VLTLVAEGRSNREIGSEIHIEESTVKTHLKSIFAKLHKRGRTEGVTVATRRGSCGSRKPIGTPPPRSRFGLRDCGSLPFVRIRRGRRRTRSGSTGHATHLDRIESGRCNQPRTCLTRAASLVA